VNLGWCGRNKITGNPGESVGTIVWGGTVGPSLVYGPDYLYSRSVLLGRHEGGPCI